METSFDFQVGDIVLFTPNGLFFRCENKKMLVWMKDSGNYVKVVDNKNSNSKTDATQKNSQR